MILAHLWTLLVCAAGLHCARGSDTSQTEPASEVKSPASELDEKSSDASPLYLTPYINACDYETAKEKSQVKLFQVMANVSAYSGLITVNNAYNSNLFFLFLVAEGNKSDAPILLWTQGGPGLSSLFGQFLENGPIAYDANPNISIRSNTLQKNMSVIYLDVPVGAGFSFTESNDGYSKTLEDINEHVMEFLDQFFQLFYEFKNRDFYLAGESYGARYSIAIANELLTKKRVLPLNYKGTIGGNGFLGPVLYTADSTEFLYHTSMLDDKGRYEFGKRFELMRNMTMSNVTISQVPYLLLTTIFADFTRKNPSFFQNLTKYNDHASPLYTERPFHMLACFFFLNSSVELRRSIHVGDSAVFQYGHPPLIAALASDWLRDISHMTQHVLNESRVLFYTGQLDALFPSVNQRTYFSTLKWVHDKEYQAAPRTPWSPPTWNQYMGFAGFMKKAPNFTEVVLLGMSHYGAAEKPDEAYYLTTQFIAGMLEPTISPALNTASAKVAPAPNSVQTEDVS